MNTLFDTGATSSIMSGEMFRKLTNKHLDTSRLPRVVSASGASLGALGRVNCKISINGYHFDQTFLVCEHVKRAVILGIDFARNFSAGYIGPKKAPESLPSMDKLSAKPAKERDQLAVLYTSNNLLKYLQELLQQSRWRSTQPALTRSKWYQIISVLPLDQICT